MALLSIDRCAVIFDWDDTLMPTTYLNGRNVFHGPIEPEKMSEFVAKVAPLQDQVKLLLQAAQTVGHVFILTNAEVHWVTMCCQKVWPGFTDFLTMHQIPVISGRTYESRFPQQPLMWKYQAILEEILPRGLFRCLVGVGDASTDRGALRQVCYEQSLIMKSFWCRQAESVEDILQRTRFMTHYLPTVAHDVLDLDLRLYMDHVESITVVADLDLVTHPVLETVLETVCWNSEWDDRTKPYTSIQELSLDWEDLCSPVVV